MDSLISQVPFFTPEHRSLAQSVAELVEREIEPRAAMEDDVDGLARDFVKLLAGAGILNYAIATTKLDVRALCLIREELAYSSALADLAFVMQGLGTFPIASAAPDHVRDFWLSRAANGKAIAAFALTEPTAGSDVAGIQTTARRDGESYVIDGRKRFISNAGIADFYTVFAKTGAREDGRPVISAFVVSAKMQGFRVVERTSLIAGLLFGVAGFFVYGAAWIPVLFFAGIPLQALWGLASPASLALMSRHVGADEQGQLQGANASIQGIASMLGPGLFSLTFAYAIRPELGFALPGAPFFLAGLMLLAAAAIAWRVTRAPSR